jgi:endonuclease G
MAKLRRNHSSESKGLQATFRIVIGVVLAAICIAMAIAYFKRVSTEHTLNIEDQPARTFLPSARGEVVHHSHFSLSYLEKHEQAEWVAYILEREGLEKPRAERKDWFEADKKISTGSATYEDYKGSGFSRGHLVPAADMAFDKQVMQETFMMSNISPQLKAFNNGIWKELEENVRNWAKKDDQLFIVTGPVLDKASTKRIGKANKVTVPDFFYKVILDYIGTEKKAIGFIIPNELSSRRLEEYMVSVDEVEAITGIDFFTYMIEDEEEEKLESNPDQRLWKTDEKKYWLRINTWNKQ